MLNLWDNPMLSSDHRLEIAVGEINRLKWILEIEREARNRECENADQCNLDGRCTNGCEGARNDLFQIVSQILDAGHMNQEDLARLRAAYERS